MSEVSVRRWGIYAALIALTASPVGGRLDPTRPGAFKSRTVVADTAEEMPKLTSILIGESRRVAVIDGQPAAEGETVGGARVHSIEPTHVVVGVGVPEERIVLRLDRADIVKEMR